MSDPPSMSRSATVIELNQTPIGEAVTRLLAQEKVSVPPYRLALAVALEWALENLPVAPVWARAVDQAVGLAEANDPEDLHEALSHHALLNAPTLKEAGLLLLSVVVDMIPADTQPA